MPKIVINEYDKTKAGTVPYQNFAVVVPGFVAEDKENLSGVFDENGVYECSSQSDFVANIGKQPGTFTVDLNVIESAPDGMLVAAEAPTLACRVKFDKDNKEKWEGEVKAKWVTSKLNADNAADTGIGTAIYKNKEDFEAVCEAIHNGSWVPTEGNLEPVTPAKKAKTSDPTYYLYTFKVKTGDEITDPPTIGKLEDAVCHYTLLDSTALDFDRENTVELARVPTVTNGVATIEAFTPYSDIATDYVVIQKGMEGRDKLRVITEVTHYGNQMAYELLGLGYTVLYKKMTREWLATEFEDEDANGVDDITTTEAKVSKLYEKYLENYMNLDADGKAKEGLTEEEKAEAELYGNAFTAVPGSEGRILRLKATLGAPYELGTAAFWDCLKDKSTYDFRYVVTGLLTGNDAANTQIKALCDHSQKILLDDASLDDGRGDCFALIDIDSVAYANKVQKDAIPLIAEEATKWESAYCAVFAPYVTYIMADDIDYLNNKTFPASFHYLACAANSANNNYNEWYANAGYTRGVASYTIESTGCKFGEVAIQALEPRFLLKVGKKKAEQPTADHEYDDINTSVAVNLIVKIKSSYYLWGNRTAKKLGTRGAADGDLVAQHFLNIRQLCTTIKKQVYVTCRRLTFDPNSEMLWINFRSLLTPMLDRMKADQGIKDYKFVKDYTDRKALLKARIHIVPIEAVEDFDIGLYLEDSLENVVVSEG